MAFSFFLEINVGKWVSLHFTLYASNPCAADIMLAYALDREEAQIWWAAFLRETISMRNNNGLINSPTSPARRYVSVRLRVYSGLSCIVLDCLRQEPTSNEA